jgi:hypothetical protein
MFERTGAPAGQRAVRLRGKGANHQAVGARVTAYYSNGTEEVSEVSSGGGYLSQSTTDLFCHHSNGATVERVEVTWPTGETTSSKTSVECVPIVLSQP